MKPALARALIASSVLLVLVAVNVSLFHKERIRSQGELILLELAPVDPRSLMQGDYMALRFRLAAQLSTERSGLAPLILDSRGVASLHPGPGVARLHIRYRVRHGQVWLGTNAWFFEEGSAERFAHARYGEFRLDRESGEAVLTGLRDMDFRAL